MSRREMFDSIFSCSDVFGDAVDFEISRGKNFRLMRNYVTSSEFVRRLLNHSLLPPQHNFDPLTCFKGEGQKI